MNDEDHYGGTVGEALEFIDAPEWVRSYFEGDGFTNEGYQCARVFASEPVYRQILVCYRSTLSKYHSDKGGNDDGENLHTTMSIRGLFKKLYRQAAFVDLLGIDDEDSDDDASINTNDSNDLNNDPVGPDEDGSDDDSSDFSQDASDSDELDGLDKNATIPETPPRLLSAAKGAKKPSSRERGLLLNVPQEAPDDAKNPLEDYKHLIGRKVKTFFPCLGKVTAVKIDEENGAGILYHLYYPEDGDDEDLDEEEISKLECYKQPSLGCGRLGGCYWKDFKFEGTVESLVVGESSLFVFPWM